MIASPLPDISQASSSSQISSLHTCNITLTKIRLITIACELITRDYDERMAFLRGTTDINRTRHILLQNMENLFINNQSILLQLFAIKIVKSTICILFRDINSKMPNKLYLIQRKCKVKYEIYSNAKKCQANRN